MLSKILLCIMYIFVYILCNFFDDPSFLLGKMLVVVHFPSLAPKSVNTHRWGRHIGQWAVEPGCFRWFCIVSYHHLNLCDIVTLVLFLVSIKMDGEWSNIELLDTLVLTWKIERSVCSMLVKVRLLVLKLDWCSNWIIFGNFIAIFPNEVTF